MKSLCLLQLLTVKSGIFGRPTFKHQHCNALLWYDERLGPNKRTKNPSFGMSKWKD
jgi:hypothetical protein